MNTNDKQEYLLLFRGPDWDHGMTREELERALSGMLDWMSQLQASGKFKGGQPLARTGQIVKHKSRLVVDGPFAETKEAVGGYMIVEAASLEEAAKIAQTYPALDFGISVEVRPLLDECPCFIRARARLATAEA